MAFHQRLPNHPTNYPLLVVQTLSADNMGVLRAVHHLWAVYRFDIAHVCQQTFPINAMPMEFSPFWSSPLFHNYVTCLRLESQVLVTLELPMHPHLATTDCMSAHYISVLVHDVGYLPVLFVEFEPGFPLCLHCNATQARCKCGLSQRSRKACQVHKLKCRRGAIGCQLRLASG